MEGKSMKKRLLDILACPICKHHPLDLRVFREDKEIEEGMLLCSECGRWYPIIETIPHMLPDDMRVEEEDTSFLRKWRGEVPEEVFKSGKPFNLGKE